ncbi:DUF924 family protein [Kangiella marina]|uniref:DUF924 family protein n=1 Tax=Kangiella marina TaxID=1079178 RepID=A0ABP8IAH7_9GAMM
MQPADILSFWFQELQPKDWWVKSYDLDNRIAGRFGECHLAASLGELESWRRQGREYSASGLLAEIIVLDQFSRNIFRDSPKAFAQDAQALTLSQLAVSLGLDSTLTDSEKQFLYMPYMHSESRVIHQHAVPLFKALGDDKGYSFELKHKEIIDRFGRYPHRNSILGRQSTDEELEFLQQPGSSF